jgi:hypothetical protein
MFAFVSEPLLAWLNYYQLLEWKYYYSFPIYTAIAIILKWFINILKKQAAINKMKI